MVIACSDPYLSILLVPVPPIRAVSFLTLAERLLTKMSMLQIMRFESGLLTVDARGEFSLEEGKRAFLDILVAVAQHRAIKVLIDYRNVNGRLEDIERFYYGDFAAEEVWRLFDEHGIKPRFAYVLGPPLGDPRGLAEIVAVSKGMNVKVFENTDDAIEWLDLIRANKSEESSATGEV